jgi:hypothetical protein
MKNCIICGVEVTKKLCGSRDCRSEFSRRTIQNTFKKHGEITQFRKTNGMHDPATREKVSTKLRAMQWKPTVQGGNGKPPPIQQVAMAAALGWKMEVAVPTKMGRGIYPTCYKLDVGNSALKIGVEIDGNSHFSTERKAQDKKKTEFLESIGWKVLRFTNKEVEADLNRCVQAVLSII